MAGAARGYDVVVVGGGNAALTAAVTARQAGATVLRAGARAKGHARRQQPAHPQSARHARRADRDAHGVVS